MLVSGRKVIYFIALLPKYLMRQLLTLHKVRKFDEGGNFVFLPQLSGLTLRMIAIQLKVCYVHTILNIQKKDNTQHVNLSICNILP